MRKQIKYRLDDPHHLEKREKRNLNFFWISFLTYSMGYTLGETGHANYLVCQAFQLLGLLVIAFSMINLIQFKIDDSYFKFVFVLYCCWLFYIVLKGLGLLFDYNYLKSFLFDPNYGGMLYFAPLIVIFPRTRHFFTTLFNAIFVFSIIYIVYDVFFLKDLLNSDWGNLQGQGIVELSSDLSFPCGFLLLTYKYHPGYKKIFALVGIILILFFSIIRARRGLILMTSMIALASYLLYFFTSRKKPFIIYLTILAISVAGIYAVAVYKPNKTIFSSIRERGTEDTRTIVELFFYADMKLKDWIMGRGIHGQYFSPGIEVDSLTDYRSVIETGYLQIILKGGLISLVLLLLICVPAMILGLFYSKNLLSKAAGLWILLALLSLYPATVNTFTFRYLLVWVSIGICYNKKMRMLSDKKIKESFFPEPKLIS